MAGSRREREIARIRMERQVARRAQARARARRRNAMLGSALAVVLVVGGVAFLIPKLASTGTSSPAKTVGKTAAPGPTCLYIRPTSASKAARNVGFPPVTDVDKTQRLQATMVTNLGTVSWRLNVGAAPCTVNAMQYLAAQKYYDKTPCHRLTSGALSVLQCGDPTGTGSGGPGFVFPDENLKGATYPAGTVAMANSGPNTNGSQFFLVYKNSQLSPNYTPFATITQGLDVLTRIAAAGSVPAGDGKPKKPVQILTLRVTRQP